MIISCAVRDSAPPSWITRTSPIEIYVDDSFTTFEQFEMQCALDAWVVASGGLIKFNVHWNVAKPGPLYKFIDKPLSGRHFIWQIDYNNTTHLTTKLQEEFKNYHGLFFGSSENKDASNTLIFTDLIERRHFSEVFAHEIGHLLGIEHITNHKEALMFSNAGKCISKWDSIKLCKLYGCIPKDSCIKLLPDEYTP